MWHLLVDDPAAGGHPLYCPFAKRPAVPKTVAVIHTAGKHIGHGLYSAMRVPWETCLVVLAAITSKVVEEQKRIGGVGVAKTKRTVQVDACTLPGSRGLAVISNRVQ
jgi:hypothetical protein